MDSCNCNKLKDCDLCKKYYSWHAWIYSEKLKNHICIVKCSTGGKKTFNSNGNLLYNI